LLKQIDYVMIGVSNMEQSVGFYKDILGMPLKYQTMSGLSSRPGHYSRTLPLKTQGPPCNTAEGNRRGSINDRVHRYRPWQDLLRTQVEKCEIRHGTEVAGRGRNQTGRLPRPWWPGNFHIGTV